MYVFFLIKAEKFLEKFSKTLEKISNIINKKVNSEPVHNKKISKS